MKSLVICTKLLRWQELEAKDVPLPLLYKISGHLVFGKGLINVLSILSLYIFWSLIDNLVMNRRWTVYGY